MLSVDLNGVPLCSKPIALMSLTKVQGSKEIDQKLLHLTEVCSDSKEKVICKEMCTCTIFMQYLVAIHLVEILFLLQ